MRFVARQQKYSRNNKAEVGLRNEDRLLLANKKHLCVLYTYTAFMPHSLIDGAYAIYGSAPDLFRIFARTEGIS